MPFDLPEPEIIATGVEPEAALAFWAWKSALPHDVVKRLEEGARERAFYVTGLSEFDAVQSLYAAMSEALKNGETLQHFKERSSEVIERQGWHDSRVDTIFRNNMQTAYAAGRYAKIQEVKAFRPYLQYFIIEDGRARPTHAILNNLVYPVDHEFWKMNYPPNGHKCRCGVRTLSEKQLSREGLEVQTTMPGPGMVTDPATGMEYHVAIPGADKGWQSNPGKGWTDDLRQLSIAKMENEPTLAPALVRRIVQNDLETWSKEPVGNFPLAAITTEDAKLIGGTSIVARLSPATWAKQRKHHPELTLRDYGMVQDAVEQGSKIQQDARNIVYVLNQSDGVLAVVKATQEGEELYVTSVRRMSSKEAERDRTIRKLKNRREK